MQKRRRRDLEDKLRFLAKDTAIVDPLYGGFEIIVKNPERFPWAEVMDLITAIGQDVWVRRHRGRMVIDTKPPSV